MKRLIIGSAYALALSSGSLAAVTHADLAGTTQLNSTTVGGKLQITLTVLTQDSNGENRVRLDFDSNDNVERIWVSDPNEDGPVTLLLGTTSGTRPNNVERIIGVLGELIIEEMTINGSLGNSSNSNHAIFATRVESAIVHGDLTSPILVKNNLPGSSPIVARLDYLEVAGDMTAGINISTLNVGDGEIGMITVTGDIGTTSNIVSIRAPNGMELLEGDNIHAAIDSVISGYSPASIGRIDATGDFFGKIMAKSLVASGYATTAGLNIDGDFEASEPGTSPVVPVLELTDDLASGQLVRIGGSFPSGSYIRLPYQGLEGQISINAEDNSATWGGQVRLQTGGSFTFLDEDYADLPSLVGGGAAGTAPFAMHESTASPATPHYVFITGIDILDPMMECYEIPFDDEISFRLYGPASIESGTGTPAKVQINSSGWTDDFDIDAEIVSSTGSRGLKFVRKSGGTPIAWPQVFGEYRIVPKADRIVSVDVTGEPTVEFEYYIELLDGCGLMLLEGYDLNTDDDVCMEDMGWWLDTPVDLNGDEDADSADAALLLRAIDIYQNR